MSGFQLQRFGMIMEPEPGNTLEAAGMLNPAVVRGPDGHPRKIIYRSAEPVLTPVKTQFETALSLPFFVGLYRLIFGAFR